MNSTAGNMGRMPALLLLGQGLLTMALLLGLPLLSHGPPISLVRWDAVWYHSVAAQGYAYRPGEMNSTAFFPFFPWLWGLSRLSDVGISLLNLGVTALALVLLRRFLLLRPVALVLFAALPSAMFLYLPYTEALFFLFSSLVLIGVARGFRPVGGVWVALLLGALTRVAAMFYLPGLVAVELAAGLAQQPPGPWLRLRRLVLLGTAPGLGLLAVLVYQWQVTGVWFAFSKTQHDGWHRVMRLPQLPFASAGSGGAVLDGLALLVGLLASGWVVVTLVQVARYRAAPPRPEVIFSAVLLGCPALHTTLFAPLSDTGHTTLMSLHRYVFCTPFFLVLLHEFLPRRAVAGRTVMYVLLAVVLLTALMGLFTLTPFVQRSPLTGLRVPGLAFVVLVLCYVMLWLRAHARWAQVLLYGGGLVLQFLFFYTFAVGRWVG